MEGVENRLLGGVSVTAEPGSVENQPNIHLYRFLPLRLPILFSTRASMGHLLTYALRRTSKPGHYPLHTGHPRLRQPGLYPLLRARKGARSLDRDDSEPQNPTDRPGV